MSKVTYFVAPGVTDDASQFRIYKRQGEWYSALTNYRKEPEAWKEVGLVNSQGLLVCLDAPQAHVEEIADTIPLETPYTFVLEE